MRKHFSILSCLLISMLLLITACSPTPEAPIVQDETAQPVNTSETAVTNAPELTSNPEEPQLETEPTGTEPARPDPTAEIIHQTQPGKPVYTQAITSECNTGYNFNMVSFKVQQPCDSWDINLLERAVSADLSQFYAYLDILSAQAGISNGWLYFNIDLFEKGAPDDGVPLTYYVEIDLDQNGRGDILLSVTDLSPERSNWTVTGVKALQDLTGDVGGITAVRADQSSNGDGYETLIFDEGNGDDPDLAWARWNPDKVNQIEFAIKVNLLNNDLNFMWWVGAMRGSFNPQAFDLVDSQDSADFFEIDTTCGLIYGREEAYNLKKCYVAPVPTPTVQVQHAQPDPTQQPTPEPTEEVCVQPPHPNPQDNCWIWMPDQCEWVCFN